MQIIENYLNKRGITGPWKIDPQPQKKFHQTVVIPAFGESELLPHTLTSLDKNNASIQKNTLVVVVVNNAENSPAAILKNNQTTLKILTSGQYNFTLGIVDAASPKLELPTNIPFSTLESIHSLFWGMSVKIGNNPQESASNKEIEVPSDLDSDM